MHDSLSTPHGELIAKIDKALQHVFDLAAGRERWTMRVPARPDEDSDIILAEALNDARRALSAPSEKAATEAQPSATDATEKDAERYRWLKSTYDIAVGEPQSMPLDDDLIDDAMAAIDRTA